MSLWAVTALLSLNILGSACLPQHTESSLAASGETQQVTLDIDLSQTHPVSELLYGIFFEEVRLGEPHTLGQMVYKAVLLRFQAP